jgi:hypothetical protein
MLMVIIEFFTWWYTAGYKKLLTSIGNRLRRIGMAFSVPQLLLTLFSPWRRIISYGGGSISDRLKAVLDNLISRIVGAVVRIIVILVAGVSMVAVSVGGALALILWPLAPVIAVILVLRGLLPW